MKELRSLLEDFPFQGDGAVPVTKVVCDSRKVEPGCAFVCIEGFVSDGHQYAPQACERGAAVIVAQKPVAVSCPVVYVEDSRKALAKMCASFHGHPSRKFRLVGVTGTNGKTTITFLIKTILEQQGMRVGLIGTNQNMICGKVIETARTTPDAFELQGLFAQMAGEQVDVVVMEVSSHALALDRVYDCAFDVGVFTNITQDHLDFHKTMEAYLQAKIKLFQMCKTGVVNLDDPHAKQVLEQGACSFTTVGIDKAADLRAQQVELHQEGVAFSLEGTPFHLAIPGRFSVYNALCAIGACRALGVPMDRIAEGLKGAHGVRGRAQVVDLGFDFTVLIDYAHSPDGLENILNTARGFAKGRVVILFGCGGDRDKTKRPIMGKIASQLADFCIVTSDNPRTEDPHEIIQGILVGVKDCDYTVIENRKEAIRYAVTHAQKDDVVILAGKGHETYQTIGKENFHFDEEEILFEIRDEIKGC